ncbi:PAS domain S-box protein [Deinococcus sp. QL22]|uniref:PAS domain S-box protein n=1 Tax=Deinococcus sp. QL22 TaxID=2939437 RepID=UPI002016EE0C|nr:PAS domain S-box protein [Deinococcus sp. QL22]UQN10750.1 PAS domain S-box protein [Deinococcus sp. QL22]UQN10796.1 PAS domain S-box protein [Deinococcus sp. QL22]
MTVDLLLLMNPEDDLEALGPVLAQLPTPRPAVLIAHSFSDTGPLVERLSRDTAPPVQVAEHGTVFQPGQLYVSPAHHLLEVRPDFHCTVTLLQQKVTAERPLDWLLASLAAVYTSRVLAVVLGGAGRDGFVGLQALRGVGGTVVVLKPDHDDPSAELPRLVMETGAADQLVARHELGQSLTEVLSGLNLAQAPDEAINDQSKASSSLDRSTEEKYRLLFDTMGQGYCELELIRDADGRAVDQRYLELNPAFERLFGIPAAEARGRKASEVFPSLEPGWHSIFDRVVKTGTPERIEYPVAALGRWFEVFAYPAGGDRLSVLYEDVTERKQAEDALRESGERQAFLLELSDALRAEPDADTVTNRALELLAQHLHLDRCFIGVYYLDDDRGDFTHQVGNDRVPPVPSGVRLSDFPDALRVAFDSTLVVSDVARDENLSEIDRQNLGLGGLGMGALVAATLRKGEQHPLWAIVAISANARHWTPGEITLIEEVTERTWAATQRVQAETARRDSEARFRAVANLVPDLLWESEPDGVTTWYNQRWLDYTGQTFEQATGWGWTDAIHPDDREASARGYQAAVESGQSLRQEHRIRRRDGEYRWFVLQTSPLKNEGGQVTKIYGAATDIHDLRTMNVTLEAQVAERTRRLVDLNTELLARTRALEAFSHLTRDLALDTDRVALVHRAQKLVMTLLPRGFTAYFEPEGEVWRKKAQVGDPSHPALQALMEAGLPFETPGMAYPFKMGQPEYQNAYVPGTDAPAELVEHIHSTATLPVRLGGVPVGLFSVLQFELQVWSPANRAILETVVQHLNLALDRAEAVRQLTEEREALNSFAQFTELTASTSDVQVLAQHAADVLQQVLAVDSAVYFEQEGELWKARSVSGALTPEIQRQLEAGLPASTASLMMPVTRRESMFFDDWQPEAEGLPTFAPYRAVARYPLFPQNHPVGVLSMARADGSVWSAREKAVFQAIGNAFRLALERTAQVQQIDRQRARLADLNAELGTLITRTARHLEVPAQRLSHLLGVGAPVALESLKGLPPYDPVLLQEEITRLNAVAQDLRQLSVLEAQQLHNDLLPLGELFAEVRDQLPPSGRQPTWFLNPLPIVRGDRSLLRQALDVVMTFTLSPTRGTRYVTVSSQTVDGEVRVWVEDDGVGLTGEEAATLFDLTVRTDQQVPVLEGSGLMQVRRIMARHGGWAWAEQGSRVVLAFPQEEAMGQLDALFLDERPGL